MSEPSDGGNVACRGPPCPTFAGSSCTPLGFRPVPLEHVQLTVWSDFSDKEELGAVGCARVSAFCRGGIASNWF